MMNRAGHLTVEVVIGIAIAVFGMGLIAGRISKPTTKAAATKPREIVLDGNGVSHVIVPICELWVARLDRDAWALYRRSGEYIEVLATANKPEGLQRLQEAESWVTQRKLTLIGKEHSKRVETRQVFTDKSGRGDPVIAPSPEVAITLGTLLDCYWSNSH